MCASSPLAAPSPYLKLDISHVRFGSESKVEIWEWMFHVNFFFSSQKPTNKRYVWEMETSNSFLFDQQFSKYCVVFARIFHLMSHSITLLCELSSLKGRMKKISDINVQSQHYLYDMIISKYIHSRAAWTTGDREFLLIFSTHFFFSSVFFCCLFAKSSN